MGLWEGSDARIQCLGLILIPVLGSRALPLGALAAWRAGLEAFLSKPRMALEARGCGHITQEFRLLQNIVLPPPPVGMPVKVKIFQFRQVLNVA